MKWLGDFCIYNSYNVLFRLLGKSEKHYNKYKNFKVLGLIENLP